MLALLGAIAATASAQTTGPGRCHANLCNAGQLAPFLARLRASRPDDGAPLHIVQIGDSHTAGDMITSGWRSRLQARYGAGGRGVLAAGRPYQGYLTWGVTASQTPGWSVNALFGGRWREDGPWLGLSGFTQTARSAGETLAVVTDTPDQNFDRIMVCAILQPGAGTVLLRMGEAAERWPLNAPRRASACRTMDVDTPVASASIATEDSGEVSITSFATFRRQGGVVLSNLGVVGAQLVHFGRTSDAVVRAELAAYRPDLIVLAFGTNEGFSPSLTPDGYEAALRAAIGRIRHLAGEEVPILLLGPPDAGARVSGAGGCGDGWSAPALLDSVRERQQRVARALGLAFWNWSAAMGGRCAASRWRLAGRMRGDHVHFTRDGGDRIGAMIDADLTAAAEEAAAPAGERGF